MSVHAALCSKVPVSGGAEVFVRDAEAVNVMRAIRLLESADVEMRNGPGIGPSGARTTSPGSRGQLIARRRTLRTGRSVIDPRLVPSRLTLAAAKDRLLFTQSWIMCVSSSPQISSMVLAPVTVTVPPRLRTSAGRTRPSTTRTTVCFLERNRTDRNPSERSERLHSADMVGALV